MESLEQINKIMEILGRLDERTERTDKEISGNGQPGLKQRVSDLEASKNRLWGFGSATLALGGAFEFLWHYLKGK